jgi:signal transduction histidine kinase
MKRTGILLLIIFSGFIQTANCQQKKLDSLLTANNNHAKEDSGKVLLMINISKEYRKQNKRAERFAFAEAAVALGEKIKFYRPLPAIYNGIALYYEGISEFEKSSAAYTRAIDISEMLGDKEGVAGYSLNFGTVYQTLGDYPRALSLYQIAANYYLHSGNAGMLADCYINMGGIYNDYSRQTGKALEYLNKALDLFRHNGKDGDQRGMAESYNNIGSTYLAAPDAELVNLQIKPNEKYAVAREFYAKSLAIALKNNDSSLRAEVNNLMGDLEEKQMNYPAAIREYQAAVIIYSALGHKKYVTEGFLNLGRVYRKENDFSSGLVNLHTALADAKQMKVNDIQSDAYFNLSGIHESLHHFDSAYFFYRQYIVMRDSISNTEKQKEFTRKQLQFEFGIKEREYQLTQQLSDARIRQQTQQLSLRNKQLELTQREKEIEKLSYLQKQSELETDRKLKIAQLKQKDLQHKLETGVTDQKINEQQSQIRTDRKLTLFMAVALILLSGAAFIVYDAKQRSAKLNRLVVAQKEELEEMGRVKDKIFSIVSHDMRAPVNNIVAFSSILEDGDIDADKLALYVDQIKGTLDHTSALMENLLNWAASQMQGFKPIIEKVQLAPLINYAIHGAEQSAKKKKLSFNNSASADAYVTGDKNMIELIIRNLVNNAVKFSKHNGALEVIVKNHADGSTGLSVKDNGIGISEARVEKINAHTVHTLDSTQGTDKEKGTGLGLMLCKHFAGLMNGNISVESKEGSGSVFTVSLPTA